MSVFDGKRVAFVGGGMMGTAMLGGLLREELLAPTQVIVSDISTERGDFLKQKYGVGFTTSNAEAVTDADAVVLAVKPQFFGAVADDINGKLDAAQVVLSIMAGVKIGKIAHELDAGPVVRSIPNTPGSIGQGISAWLAAENVDEVGLEMARHLLGALGETLQVPSERYIDMATAISGSGPAFVFLFMEAMMDAAVHMGFSRADAEKLVIHTVGGSAAYLDESGEHVAALRNQVTSPGGTTAEGLYHMEKSGLRSVVARGIWGAYQRSQALGGGEPRNPDTST